MKRLLPVLLGAAVLATGGAAQGSSSSTAFTAGAPALPSASSPNSGLPLASSWLSPPAAPIQLTEGDLMVVWQRASQAYGVPWNVLAAINKIESNFGQNMGPSSAGAIGWMQFMPSTWLRWGIDADGNGVADPWNPVDAIYSAARYLAASGAGIDIRRAIFSYNHADWYVNEVVQLAELYARSGAAAGVPGTLVTVDQLQSQIAQAAAEVAQADQAYQAAEAKAEEAEAREHTADGQTGTQPLLSDQLEAQKRAAQLGAGAYAARAEADRLKAELESAQAKLGSLQRRVQAASFGDPTGQTGVPPQGVGTYVFPVGGGPTVVSVSHAHHDYPAADIAAPMGTPVYALSNGTVLASWSSDPRCGIGFTMKTVDGQTWTYCHLSYLYPVVGKGTLLHAGDGVGLVGQTGDATGPHLHLQLQPARSYPQAQQWFQSLAGTAFSWSDQVTTQSEAPGPPPVFHVVDESG